MKNERTKIRTELRNPLIFFGLELTIVEGTFGASLLLSTYTTGVLIVIIVLMSGLFVLSASVVAYLIYKVPTHLILTSPTPTKAEVQDVTSKISPDIVISRRAAFSIKSLISMGFTGVLESVNKLAQYGKKKALPPQVKQLDMAGNIYVLRSSGDIRIVFQICDNRVEILDLVRRTNLDSMFGRERLAEG